MCFRCGKLFAGQERADYDRAAPWYARGRTRLIGELSMLECGRFLQPHVEAMKNCVQLGR